MTLLRSVPNGTVYLVTVPNSGGNTTQTFYLSQVWGNPYQQGYAQGLLLANEISQFMNEAWNYIDSQVEEVLYPYIPVWLANKIGTDGNICFSVRKFVEFLLIFLSSNRS